MGGSQSHDQEANYQTKELEKSKDHPDNKKLEGDDSFKGPSDDSKRYTTDCLCALMIIAMWISLTAIGFCVTGVIRSPSLPSGNPAKLTHMIDYDGGICSVTSGVVDKPYAYFMPSGSAVCVDKCPTVTDFKKYICTYDLKQYADKWNDSNEQDVVSFAFVAVGLALQKCFVHLETAPGPGYICLYHPNNDELKKLQANVEAKNTTSYYHTHGLYKASRRGSLPASAPSSSAFANFSADLMEAWYLILIFGFVVAMAVGFVCLRLLRIPCLIDLIIWGAITGVFVVFLAIGFMLKFVTANRWAAESPQVHESAEIVAVSGLGYFFLALAALWFCIICCVGRKIFVAVGITKEAAKALGAMSSLIFFPILQTAALLAFSAVWFVYLVYLASSGEIVTNKYKLYGQEVVVHKYEYSVNTQKAYWYLIFCWFWTSEFIMAVGQIVTAMSCAFWYFAKDKSTINSTTVSRAIRTTLRYHLGTAAFGSLIIAIIKTIRAFIAYLQSNAERLAARGGAPAVAIAKIVLCCLQCCMWCIEKCAKFLNKYAYIQTAIFSYSFCKAARKAFFLILRNLLLIGAVTIVSEFILLLLVVLIPLITTFIAYLVYQSMGTLHSVVGVTVFTFALAYFTATKFTETFGMVISTILCCYVADTEMFPPEKRFAGGSLRTAVASGNAAAHTGGGKVAPEESPAKGSPVELTEVHHIK